MRSSTSSSDPAWRFPAAFLLGAVLGAAALFALPWLSLRASTPLRVAPGELALVGDSRALYGVDVALLERRLEAGVRSFSDTALGVYDLAVVADTLPAGARLLVLPSLAMLSRDPASDRNMAGLSPWAFARLARSGTASWRGLARTLAANRGRFTPRLVAPRAPYAVADAPIDRFDALFVERIAERPDVATHARKRALFWAAVDRALARGCRLWLAEVSVGPRARALRADSPFADFSTALADGAARRELPFLAPPRLGDADGNLMYDISHLNAEGRRRYTEALAHWLRATPPGGGPGRGREEAR